MVKIVIAPDSFKESLTAAEVAEAIEKGWKKVLPETEVIKVPMADGGEGTTQSLIDATGGKIIKKEVTGPLGEMVEGFYGILGDNKTAVIEVAAAAGLHYVPRDKRNPSITTTKGVGELILAALDDGAKHIILGLGGSATNDGGAGMVQALGVRLLNKEGKELSLGGGALSSLEIIDISQMDKRLAKTTFEVACDVDNPLTGERGASAIFGPQKGATAEMVQELDEALTHYAQMIEKYLGKQVIDKDGVGAAGGIGAGVLAFFNSQLKRGIDIVIAATNLEETVRDADLIITGEGRIDSQTIYGKTPIGVAKVAKKFDIPVIGIAGSITPDSEVVYEHGIDILFPIVQGVVTLEEALVAGAENLERTSRNVAKIVKIYEK